MTVTDSATLDERRVLAHDSAISKRDRGLVCDYATLATGCLDPSCLSLCQQRTKRDWTLLVWCLLVVIGTGAHTGGGLFDSNGRAYMTSSRISMGMLGGESGMGVVARCDGVDSTAV
jgi:hypothetical protein